MKNRRPRGTIFSSRKNATWQYLEALFFVEEKKCNIRSRLTIGMQIWVKCKPGRGCPSERTLATCSTIWKTGNYDDDKNRTLNIDFFFFFAISIRREWEWEFWLRIPEVLYNFYGREREWERTADKFFSSRKIAQSFCILNWTFNWDVCTFYWGHIHSYISMDIPGMWAVLNCDRTCTFAKQALPWYNITKDLNRRVDVKIRNSDQKSKLQKKRKIKKFFKSAVVDARDGKISWKMEKKIN